MIITAPPAGDILSPVADGATAVAFTVDTVNALANAAAKLQQWKSGGTLKSYIDKDGTPWVGAGVYGSFSGAARLRAVGGSVYLEANDAAGVLLQSFGGNATLTSAAFSTNVPVRPASDVGVSCGDTTHRWTYIAVRQLITKFFTVASSATPTFDVGNGRFQRIVVTANITAITMPAGTDGDEIFICFIQSGAGAFTIAGWPAATKLAGGAFAGGSATGKSDNLHAIYDGVDAVWKEVGRATNVG